MLNTRHSLFCQTFGSSPLPIRLLRYSRLLGKYAIVAKNTVTNYRETSCSYDTTHESIVDSQTDSLSAILKQDSIIWMLICFSRQIKAPLYTNHYC